jgi:glutamate-5-semialdehyde dehydrogenase
MSPDSNSLNTPKTLAPVDADAMVAETAARARAAAPALARAKPADKTLALRAAADAVRTQAAVILAANAKDMAEAEAKGLSGSMLDRLKLDDARLESVAQGLEAVANLADPVGRIQADWTRPNGLVIQRIAVPLGVIGVVYESRPNVTADAGGLALKAGNCVILRGGSESANSSAAIVDALRTGIAAAGLPADAIQRAPTQDRQYVGAMLRAHGLIDVMVPRGGKSLVGRVLEEARMPVIGHLEGLCHVYVDGAADIDKARAIAVNAKMRRTGVCGAAETLLVDRAIADTALPPLLDDLIAAGCAIRGCPDVQAADARATAASQEDWTTEYLDAILSIRVVDGMTGALDHIARYGSGHTDAIVTEDRNAAARFAAEVDSAIVIVNASTQYADGGEFGFGAEIGISTDKFHARGPVGADQLTSYKYVIAGDGQTRP